MYRYPDIISTDDELRRETSDLLPLDSPLSKKLSSLSNWHVWLIRKYPTSFRQVSLLVDALNIGPSGSDLRARDLQVYIRDTSHIERKQITSQIDRLLNWPAFTPSGHVIRAPAKRSIDPLKIILKEVEDKAPLMEHLLASILALKPRSAEVLLYRFGLKDGRRHTLQSVADVIGVTRERVRQIQKKSLQTMEKHKHWDDLFREKCDRLFAKYGPLVLAEDLPALDPWFEGFALHKDGWQLFLEYFSGGIAAFWHDEKLGLASENNLPLIEDRTRELVKQRRIGHPDERLFATWEDLSKLEDHGQYYWKAIANLTPAPTLTIEAYVANFLESAESPVVLSDLLAKAVDHGIQISNSEHRTVLNALGRQAVCVGRSPAEFATKNSIGVDSTRIQQFCDSVWVMWVKKFKASRVFHGEEILAWAKEEGFKEDVRESAWVATGLLHFDREKRFVTNKLVIWLREIFGERQPPTLTELIEEELRVRGVPMTAKELERNIYVKRGLSGVFQIFESDNVVKCGVNTWAYKGRER